MLVGAACIVRGLKGLFRSDAQNATDQMVALAAVSAFVLGDFLTAFYPLILDIGRLFEERSTLGAQAAKDDFIRLQTFQATIIKQGIRSLVNVEELKVGDIVLVRPGEQIPTDGRIVSGRSSIDQAAMTGESQPEAKGLGEQVYSGTKNISGSLEIEVTSL